jgi:hypothetical protein
VDEEIAHQVHHPNAIARLRFRVTLPFAGYTKGPARRHPTVRRSEEG